MLEYLDRLRQRPNHERFRFAFFVAGGVTAVIFFGWLLMLPIRFADETAVLAPATEKTIREIPQNAEQNAAQNSNSSGKGFFSGIGESFRSVVSGAGNVFNSIAPFSSLFDGATFFVKNKNDGNFPTVPPPVFNASETESPAEESSD